MTRPATGQTTGAPPDPDADAAAIHAVMTAAPEMTGAAVCWFFTAVPDAHRAGAISTTRPTGSPGCRVILTRDGQVVWQEPTDPRDPGAVDARSEGITSDPAAAARVRAVLDGGTRTRTPPGGPTYQVSVYGSRGPLLARQGRGAAPEASR